MRQVIHDLEVIDGDLSVNVVGGKVLAYSDTLYRGPMPKVGIDPAFGLDIEDLSSYCSYLKDEIGQLINDDSSQIVLNASDEHEAAYVYHTTCKSLPRISGLGRVNSRIADAREAVMFFMMAAHPSNAFSRDLSSDFLYALYSIGSTCQNKDSLTLFNVPGTIAPVNAKLAYLQTRTKSNASDTVLSLVWNLEVRMESNWYDVSVSATDPSRILAVSDWVQDSLRHRELFDDIAPATYHVYPFEEVNDPSAGDREFLVGPHDRFASPSGWHYVSRPENPQNYTITRGNNVRAHDNSKGLLGWDRSGEYVDGGEDLVFDFPYDQNMSSPNAYIKFSVTQAFYVVNSLHDLFYRYGFDEPSGNFQDYNFGKGGVERDPVLVNIQDGSDNNAFFATPPDGVPAFMSMNKYTHSNPHHDGSLDTSVIVHEYGHGLSNRLTGGPSQSSCLDFGESIGLSEGWGDFLALLVMSARNNTDSYTMASWSLNKASGARTYPYTTNKARNPLTYESLNKPRFRSPHGQGEVWAEILWILNSVLMDKHGSTRTLFPPPPKSPERDEFYKLVQNKLVPRHGNSLALQLIINGMKIQPCRPGFIQARDAIITADNHLTRGENYCSLWSAFSSRGLGPRASFVSDQWGNGVRKNDFSLPLNCT